MKQLEGKITVWKVFNFEAKKKFTNKYDTSGKVVGGKLVGKYRNYNWCPKKHTANGVESAIPADLRVYEGIHVCLSEEEAKQLKGSKSVVGKFEIPVDDVLAVGSADGLVRRKAGTQPQGNRRDRRQAQS